MSILVISPNVSCDSARKLASALGGVWQNPYETGERNFTQYDAVFKYGFSRPIKAKKTFNKTEAMEKSCDKIKFLSTFQGTGLVVPMTQDIDIARKWIKEGNMVVARATPFGHDGEGVVFCDILAELAKAPAMFWTKYIKHTHEFRINVWRNKVIAIYNKVEGGGHFTFKLYQGQEEQEQLVTLVSKIYDKIGLDFCGMDVLCDKKGNLVVLEINSAPILFPFTIGKLVTKIKENL